VWDGLDDEDNVLDNEDRTHKCSETFTTNEVM